MERKIVALVRKYSDPANVPLDQLGTWSQNYDNAMTAAEQKGYGELAAAVTAFELINDPLARRVIFENLDDPLAHLKKCEALIEKYKEYL